MPFTASNKVQKVISVFENMVPKENNLRIFLKIIPFPYP